jgi:signal transduction histidine kinase
MFRGLRLRLTLLYLFAAMALIIAVGAGTYLLVSDYFQNTTDLALRVRMAQELQLLGQPVPPELRAASQQWLASRGGPTSTPTLAPTAAPVRAEVEDDHEIEDEEGEASHEGGETDPYDSELAPIFSLPLTAQGELISNPNAFGLPVAPDAAAAASALAYGNDLRTVVSSDGTRVRLLTYPVNVRGGPPVLQLGRSMGDQDRVLSQILTSLLALGGLSAVALAIASWWLAGRSLAPAEQAWEKQQTFVANASHELRTPLTLMRASAEVAARGLAENDDRLGLMRDILTEADHMSRLVDDLLLLSRLDAGRLKLERAVIRMDDVLPEVTREVSRVAADKGIALILDQSDGVVTADPTRLRQVLLILLDNALAHTPTGGRVRLQSRIEDKRVIVSVADNGSGVAPEDLPRVFERFFRANKERQAGSGLGLAIAKSLVEAQDGSLQLESIQGVGTKAMIVLAKTDH